MRFSKLFSAVARGGVLFIGCSLSFGGAATVRAQAPAAAVTSLHVFNGADGANANAPLILAVDGNFYGTTERGGIAGRGTVFRISPSGGFAPIYNFTGGVDGSFPESALVQGADGNFYGTCSAGGVRDVGTVFRLTPAGVITPLYSFTGGEDGGVPNAALVRGNDGNFYGTTEDGGVSNRGTVFRITPAGALTTLYSFSGAQDGAFPETPLLLGADGNFYGTTYNGGTADNGTIFRITPAGALTTLYRFTGGGDGAFPGGALIQAPDGNFYGTTRRGGSGFNGTVFRITSTGVLTTLYQFAATGEGAVPNAALVRGSDDAFYGTTESGGANGRGTVFRVTTNGTLASLASFAGGGGAAGAFPEAALVPGADGALYGTTSGDAASGNGNGTVFKLPPHPLFFSGEASVGAGFYYLVFPNGTLFGYYTYGYFPYLYHNDMGFQFFIDGNTADRGVYLYDFTMNTFFFTSPTVFPYLYDFTRNAWLYYFPDGNRPGSYTSNPRVFVNLTTGEFIFK